LAHAKRATHAPAPAHNGEEGGRARACAREGVCPRPSAREKEADGGRVPMTMKLEIPSLAALEGGLGEASVTWRWWQVEG